MTVLPIPSLRRPVTDTPPGTAAPAARTGAAAAAAHDAFRPDIEGLRGLAVLLVVLYHAGVTPLGGGFVGVDVFFVISGFLITGLLVRERERTGSISFASFYARRIRRLLPAATLVLVATLVAGVLLATPLDRPGVALDGLAAGLSVGNVRFALAAGDYFATVGAPSPFLHFWSLAVEEQFYLLWPALLAAAWAAFGGRRGVALTLAAVAAASLAGSVALTPSAPSFAFYLLPTRAWQLAAGGLLAVGLGRGVPVAWPLRALAAWAGLAAIVAAALLLDGGVAYPGLAALVPTVGAVALVAAGPARLGPAALTASGPFRGLGRISYSLYLVHWPLLVLAPLALGRPVSGAEAAGILVLSVLVAACSWALVEQPFRRPAGPAARRPRRTLAAGGAVLVLVAALGGGLASAAERDLGAVASAAADDEAALAWDDGTPEPPGGASGVAAGSPAPSDESTAPAMSPSGSPVVPGSPSTAASPRPSRRPGPTPVRTPGPVTSPRPTTGGSWALPADVRPALAAARSDEERLRRDHCLAFEAATAPLACSYGDPGAAVTIALVGDSHASHWFPALEAIAKHRGWRVVPFVKVSCPFADIRVANRVLKREYTECATFREATIARLRELRPDITVVAMNRWLNVVDAADGTPERVGAGIARAVARIPGRVALLVDTPYAGQDVPACLSAHPDDVRACARPASAAAGLAAPLRAAARQSGATVVDLTGQICDRVRCNVVVDRTIVYRDDHHLTATFSRSRAPVLDRKLAAILGR